MRAIQQRDAVFLMDPHGKRCAVAEVLSDEFTDDRFRLCRIVRLRTDLIVRAGSKVGKVAQAGNTENWPVEQMERAGLDGEVAGD